MAFFVKLGIIALLDFVIVRGVGCPGIVGVNSRDFLPM